MKKDIILSGVGGQGILSIATVIGEAAIAAGLHLKQAEVHGMSQRGGDVQSHLRLSDKPIFSDLIPRGQADLIIAMEPMEALRYVQYLHPNAWIVTASEPFVNIPNYPDSATLKKNLDAFPNVVSRNIEALAKEASLPKSANMVLLGMAASHIAILTPEQLRAAIGRVFARKGERVVADNLKAFDLGRDAARQEIEPES
ncbi:MAG: indolepyruvate oxidoreductase subunit beta [Candidatus Cryptobacteroides sp.]|jgi:indolepyruvate ferredoxin oxidoreductase beta subunit|nr:indolepyruvate oxidoreductase subunit beta [Bacteroidota bacterium]NLO00135.1 indolepyruvate oxidoreductase subunit beta [Bacteroidales bacterium]